MYEHKYDENGLASSYLALVILIPVTLYSTYKLYRSRDHLFCGCKNCNRIRKRVPYFKWALVSFLWILVAILAKNVMTIKLESKKQSFDPLEILNIDEGATLQQIKKSYKKQLRPIRKIMNRPEMKEKAEEQLKLLNKAHDIMKNPGSYKKWLENESSKELVIALPSFLLNFGLSSFIIYMLIFCIAVPFYIYLNYRKLKYNNSHGSTFKSSEDFYENLKKFSTEDSILLMQLQVFMAKTPEFTSRKWITDSSPVKNIIEKNYGFPVAIDDPGYLHILDYLFRVNHSHPDDLEFVRSASLKMISAFLRIASYKKATKIFEKLLVMQKMFIQAVCSPEFYMLQFPNIKYNDILLPKPLDNEVVPKVYDSAAIEDMRKVILSMDMDTDHLKQALYVLKSIPVLEMSNVKVFTYDTSIENDSGQLVDKYESIVEKEDDQFLLEKKASATLEFTLSSKTRAKIVHSISGTSQIPALWTIYIKYNGEMSENIIYMDHFIGTKNVKITLPMWNGKGILKVHAVQNGYFGVDIEKRMNIKYY